MMSSFTTFLLILRYVVLTSVQHRMYMSELHSHSRKENLELSTRELVTGARSVLEHHPFRVGLECWMWVLTVAVGRLTVGPGLVLPVPCPSPFSCMRLLLNA